MSIKTTAACILAAGLASAASAQTATIDVTGPASVNPGDTGVTLTVSITVTGFDADDTFAGFGIGLSPTNATVTATDVDPAFETGELEPADGGRVVGGQVSNIFGTTPTDTNGANPSVLVGSTFSTATTLFTATIDVDGGLNNGDTVSVDAQDAANGGVLYYTDVTGGESLPFPTVVYNGYSVTIGPSGCPNLGDTNNDGVVDFADLTTLLANFNLPGGPAQGDTDGSGTVDFSDLTTLLANFNLPCP